MEIVALDGTKLLALMVAGGIFALAGLWLMFRPQAEGEAARVEIFGLKFQASSAGVLVFLIGAVFLAVPIFVPEKPVAEQDRVAPVVPAPAPLGGGSTNTQQPTIGTGDADAADNLTNTAAANATAINLGTSVAGSLFMDGSTTYTVAIPSGVRGRITASLVATRGRVALALFDGEGQVVGRQVADSALSGTASVAGAIESQGYIVVVGNTYPGNSNYSLTIGVRPD